MRYLFGGLIFGGAYFRNFTVSFGTFPSVHLKEGVRLIEVCKNCPMFVQRLLCTVIKFHVVEEAKEAVLYFVQDF